MVLVLCYLSVDALDASVIPEPSIPAMEVVEEDVPERPWSVPDTWEQLAEVPDFSVSKIVRSAGGVGIFSKFHPKTLEAFSEVFTVLDSELVSICFFIQRS